jgi:ferredoxin-type protein NapH
MTADRIPGREAWKKHGWWSAHRYLVLRRLSQFALLALFLTGPLLGVWIFKGTIAASLLLDRVPLTDPLVLLQGVVARHWPEMTAFIGAGIALAIYGVLGGRTYCSWVCPINPISDFAAWLRRRLGIDKGLVLRAATRWWILAMILVVSALTGTIAWELVNPITALWRAAVFGAGLSLILVAAIFLFDLFVARNGWCGHVCPVGAFYGLLGKATLLRVSAPGRARCDDCLDCFAVCPESHVIVPALRGDKLGKGPVILSGDCTVCGRCVDVCPEQVFALTHRFDTRLDPRPAGDVMTDRGPSAPVLEKI